MQVRSVLCPVDFSDASKTALQTAARFARQFKGNLHVLFVEDPLLAQVAHQVTPAPDLAGELRTFLAGTPDLDVQDGVHMHVATGEPAAGITAFGARERVDLIVMGAHGLTGVRKAFFGSTTARVLKLASVPVLVVPAAADIGKARNLEGLGAILVLSDFGPASRLASARAASLAQAVGAPLVLVHVTPRVSTPFSWGSRAESAMEQRSAEAHTRMCHEMTPLERYGPVESVIVEGNVAEQVAELARTRRTALIVMGVDRGEAGSRLGATVYPVICAAPVPVLAVPAATRQD